MKVISFFNTAAAYTVENTVKRDHAIFGHLVNTKIHTDRHIYYKIESFDSTANDITYNMSFTLLTLKHLVKYF